MLYFKNKPFLTEEESKEISPKEFLRDIRK